jgi:flagellar hook-basal body complex protein FliE
MAIDGNLVNFINSVNSTNKGASLTQGASGAGGLDFGKIFAEAMDKINVTDKASVQAGEQMAIGELQNPHDLTIASTEAELTLNYAIEVKNRIIDAYKEIMRMQF